MTTSILEQTRQYHEDIEVAEKVASSLLSEKAKRPQKFRPVYDHATLRTLLSAQDSARRLLDLYADRDGLRKEEIETFGGQRRLADAPKEDEGAGDDDRCVWLNFYDKLKMVKDGHKRTTNGLLEALAANEMVRDIPILAQSAYESCNADHLFSPEESLGRQVDLAPQFLEFTNLAKYRKHREAEFKQIELSRLRKKLQSKQLSEEQVKSQLEEALDDLHFQEIDYITYLKTFNDFRMIPRYCKYREPQYEVYLSNLLHYLQGFLKRINPLSNHDRIVAHLNGEFQTSWEKRLIPSWDVPTHKMPTYALPTDHLFATEGTLKGHATGKKYKKALNSMQSVKEQQERIDKSENCDRELANKEFLVERYRSILSSVIQRTIEQLQKKQSRTLRELEMNAEDSDGDDNIGGAIVLVKKVEEDAESEADSDEEKPIYNPLNLPLGWDGKPIPFWLYKLHGLGVEYKCEICGNYSYWGRRAFERHFQEWRHAFGMRCLKIPNTVHFKEITKIEEAILLYEKLKREAEIQAFKADQDVECEDAEGNVMSARTYEDLRRQGLL